MGSYRWLLVLMMLVVSACSGSPTDRCVLTSGVDPLLGQLAALDFEIEGIPAFSEATFASAQSPEAFAGNELRCEVLLFNFESSEGLRRINISISSFLTFDAAEDSLEHFQERDDLQWDPDSQVWSGRAGSLLSARVRERCLTVTALGQDEEMVVSAVLAARDALDVFCRSN